jgi:anti-anti-sigma factor
MNEEIRPSVKPLLIELGGEIDLRNAEALDEALCAAIDRSDAELLVDLSTVPFIDSSGMRMMVRVHEHATIHNSGVRWRGIQPDPARAVAAMGLDHVLHFDQ